MATNEVGTLVALEGDRRVPFVEVTFNYGKWWQIPFEMSQMIYEKYLANEDANRFGLLRFSKCCTALNPPPDSIVY